MPRHPPDEGDTILPREYRAAPPDETAAARASARTAIRLPDLDSNQEPAGSEPAPSPSTIAPTQRPIVYLADRARATA